MFFNLLKILTNPQIRQSNWHLRNLNFNPFSNRRREKKNLNKFISQIMIRDRKTTIINHKYILFLLYWIYFLLVLFRLFLSRNLSHEFNFLCFIWQLKRLLDTIIIFFIIRFVSSTHFLSVWSVSFLPLFSL